MPPLRDVPHEGSDVFNTRTRRPPIRPGIAATHRRGLARLTRAARWMAVCGLLVVPTAPPAHAGPLAIPTAPSSLSDDIIFLPAGTEAVRFKEGGQVGVGTSTPAHKFHVHDGAVFVTATNNLLPGLGGPMILLGGGTPADANGIWGIEYDPNAGGLNFWKPFPNPFGFGNYFLFLANNGNVGLGTPTPHERLEITGNLRLPPSTATTGVIMSGPNRLIHTFGNDNFFAGVNAGNFTTSGCCNTGVGNHALNHNTTGYLNTAVGDRTLSSNTTGLSNTAMGYEALNVNATGNANTAVGERVLQHNTQGAVNTAVGYRALWSNTSGQANTAMGAYTLYSNLTGSNNVAVGQGALSNSTGGTSFNVAVGGLALHSNTTGTNNTALGWQADVSPGTLTNATAVGAFAVVSASNSLVLGGTGAHGVNVGIRTSTPRAEMDVVGTGAIIVPVGTTGQRPATAVRGMVRFNTTNNKFEGYDGSGWKNLN